jgi:hypothetical protein
MYKVSKGKKAGDRSSNSNKDQKYTPEFAELIERNARANLFADLSS